MAMDPETLARLIELIEKIGLLRRDMAHRKDLEKPSPRWPASAENSGIMAV